MDAATARYGAGAPARRRPRARSPFYTILGLAMLGLAVAGFWPQYFGAAVGGRMAVHAGHWLVHVHAAIFVGWLLLFAAQAALILGGRMPTHRRFGPAMAVFGFAAAAFGTVAGFALAARLGERTGNADQAAAFVFAPTIDMLFLAAFLAVAVRYRKQPEIHKRAMLVATFSIAVVGLGRLVDRIDVFDAGWLWQPATLSPLLLALAYDLFVGRRLHPVLVAGTAVHALRLNQEVYTTTEAWLPIGRALVAPFA